VKAAAENPLGTARSATAESPERLKAFVKPEGGHIERQYYKQNLKLLQMPASFVVMLSWCCYMDLRHEKK
jgi:hypothetical protein